jgi:tRNA(adenine34) deaminase
MAEQWMAQAYELAHNAAERDEVPVGAILVRDGEIIGVGANRREAQNRVAAHAEIVALEDYSRRTSEWRIFPGATLFVTAEPCLMCTGALLWARVDRIYYGCSDPKKAGIERVLPLIQAGTYDHRFIEVKGGILAERCSHLMSSYFRRKRRRDSSDPKDPKSPGPTPAI